MKKYFTLLMLMIVPAMMMAQQPQQPKENERFNPEAHIQKRHQFMTEKAQLTEDEATKFFAIYEEMRKKEIDIYGNSREMRNKRPETDQECRDAMLHADSLELAIKQLQYDYHQRLLDAISPKKAVRAIMAGEEFDRMTFRDMMRGWRRGGNEQVPRHDFKGKRHDGPRREAQQPGGPCPDLR